MKEQQANLAGRTFINVQFGAPQVPACRCCDTFSFEEVSGVAQLVAVVSVRRASTAGEAAEVAESFWAMISDEAINPQIMGVSESSPYTTRMAFGADGSDEFVGELSVSLDAQTQEFIVRMYVGQ